LHPKTRLLTITGTAGIGKTHLALHLASGLVHHFDDGVFFVDLAPIGDPELVMPTIAQAPGLQEAGVGRTGDVLLRYLRQRRILLLLDNFEQVLDAASEVVELLEACPWLKVLVTSREALHVRGERRFPIAPLELPDMRQLPEFDALIHYPSVSLFIERAQATDPDFTLTQENARDVVAICVGLEGLPLAIEMAAARIRHLSPAEMRRALSNRLSLLTNGARDLPPRHRTLRNAIKWSYDLLNQAEQRLFRQAGVFVGGFTLEALNAVCSFQVSQADVPVSAFDALNSLLDKHLVHQERQVSKPGKARFVMLESVREYAIEQLGEHGETEEARHRHAGYYLSLAERAEEHFTGPQHQGWGADQIKWIDTLEADLDNMRAALDWYQALAEGGAGAQDVIRDKQGPGSLDALEKGLKLVTALRRIWLGRGYFREGLQRAMMLLSWVPKPLAVEATEFRAAYAMALLLVGRLSALEGSSASVLPLLEDAMSIFTDLNDRPRIALSLLILGAVNLARGDLTAARSYQERCLDLYRELGNKWGAAAALDDLGSIEIREGNMAAARPLLEESLRQYREVGEHSGATSILVSLGQVAYYEGDYALASQLFEEGLQLGKEIGYKSRVAQLHALLGWAALREGKYDETEMFFREGLLLARELGATSTVYLCLAGLAGSAVARHNRERAARLFGAAAALRDATSLHLPAMPEAEIASEMAAARSQSDEEAWNSHWTNGQGMTLEEAAELALGE
jgi:predicted ATPase